MTREEPVLGHGIVKNASSIEQRKNSESCKREAANYLQKHTYQNDSSPLSRNLKAKRV
jgi:hypothetical protein